MVGGKQEIKLPCDLSVHLREKILCVSLCLFEIIVCATSVFVEKSHSTLKH